MNSASAAALISHMADCIEQGFEREMRSPTGSEKTGMQLSALYPAVDRLSIILFFCENSFWAAHAAQKFIMRYL